MSGIRVKRDRRNRWRNLVVWAVLPLAVFNSRTVVGCGCNGHFESVCHCNCAKECRNCGGQPGSCPCCNAHQKSGPESSHGGNTDSDSGKSGFNSHHCKGAVQREVIPATVVTIHSADGLNATVAALDTLDLPSAVYETHSWALALELTSPPPHDIVVQLHRLII